MATTRKRGITVEILDYDKLTAACKEHGIAELSYMTNGLLRRIDGAAVVISSEGVCESTVIEDRVYLDTIVWFGPWQSLPRNAVEACLTGETRDLADHIRTFGSRLDVNVMVWQEWAAPDIATWQEWAKGQAL